MSYELSASATEYLSCDFGAGAPLGYPVTIGGFIKFQHASTGKVLMHLGKVNTDNLDSVQFRTTATLDQYQTQSYNDDAGVAEPLAVSLSPSPAPSSTTWMPVLAILAANNERRIYVGDVTQVATSTNAHAPAINNNVFRYFFLGKSLTGGLTGYPIKYAEVAIWEEELDAVSTGAVVSFLNGTSADQIAAGSLRAYWPMNVDLSDSVGTDDLVATGPAAFDTDHPTISRSGSTTLTPNTAGLSV